MALVSHQTIKLSRGKHKAPEDGACVMELASMLAGEPFSDHPTSACPVIGSFLRAYNDYIDDDRRQDLYEYAALVANSRGSQAVQEARAEHLRHWVLGLKQRGWKRLLMRGPMLSTSQLLALDPMGLRAVHALPRRNDETHSEVLALLDELLAIGVPDASEWAATAAASSPRGAERDASVV